MLHDSRHPKINTHWKALALSLLVLSLVLAVLLTYTLLGRPNPPKTPLPLPIVNNLLDPELNQYPPNDMIVNLQPVRDNLEKLAKEHETSFDMSIYIEILNTGAHASINREVRILPASLTKLPLGMAIMRKVQNQELDLKEPITLTPEDLNSESGNLYQDGAGSTHTVQKLLEHMLKNSDNTAYNALRGLTSSADLDSVVNTVGLGEIFKAGGSLSATEYARLLRALYSSAYINRKNSAFLLNLLTKSNFTDFLSAGLPPRTVFAHKWGGNIREGVYADAGIVYLPNRPYMLIVLLHEKNNTTQDTKKVTEIMKNIATFTHTYVKLYTVENN